MAHTFNDRDDRGKYDCHGANECTASWTYDDWHCTGCHWKGMGRADLKYGGPELKAEADALRLRLMTSNGEVRGASDDA